MAETPLLNVVKVVARSTINGPGRRVVVWVQGCTIGCKGCGNPSYQPHEPRYLVEPAEFADKLIEYCERTQCEGVTFSGGEPIQQAKALLITCRRLRENGISVVLFSGYSRDAIFGSSDPTIRSLIRAVDVLIAGPFDEVEWERSGTIGKEIIIVSERYDLASVNLHIGETEAFFCGDGFALLGFEDLAGECKEAEEIMRWLQGHHSV